MFKSAVFKLTAWYVGALVLVCLLFSAPIYAVTSARLRSGAERQTDYVRQLPRQYNPSRILPQLEILRERQLDKDRQQLLLSLLLINLGIIGLGAYASYLFARRTLQPIEEAHAAQAAFTSNASHELRTPLAVMQTEIEIALRQKKLTHKDTTDILTSNLEEVARLRRLSDQLLGLTRSDAHALQLKKVDLTKLVNGEAKKLSKRHKQPIETTLAKNITAQADPILLSQVIDILVDNAFAYGGPKPVVKLTLAADSETVTLAVSDKGPGIPKRDLDHIFDRFYRGGSATASRPTGHGLGLALAKDIVERHGGELAATSKTGKGSTFVIKLPRQD